MTRADQLARMRVIYDRYHGPLWRAWCALQDWRPNAWAWDPNARPVDWARWHRIDARFKREWDRAEHATHGPDFLPLWCDYCTKGHER
jgi:hypothetical protein